MKKKLTKLTLSEQFEKDLDSKCSKKGKHKWRYVMFYYICDKCGKVTSNDC